ncbi:MAG: hypothetical protein P9L91_00720 [Candidatus Zophobacter franzmannii]|jgi:hypothetical protein|nr:hypothetical protein [Candidatus Zophobacter franzmannii]
MNEEIMKELMTEILAEMKLQTRLVAKLSRDIHQMREAATITEFYGSAEVDIETTLGWKKHLHYMDEIMKNVDVPDEEEKYY